MEAIPKRDTGEVGQFPDFGDRKRVRNMGLRSKLVGLLPFAAMVVVECLDVGLTTLSKAAMSKGMSHYVFVVYSNALATLILIPSSFIIHRNKRPPLTISVLCKFFLLSLVGITLMQNCVFTGVSYSSPTLASAMSNLVPAFTFLLAAIFRMEKLDLRSSRSQIKIMGTLVSISGALVVTLYKGPPIPFSGNSHPSEPSPSTVLATANNWVIGSLFLATASLCLATWNTAQAAILKGYPSEMTIVAFYCFFGTIQCAAFSLIAERDPNAWKLRPDIELVSIVYSAVFGGVVTFSVLTWCIHKKGPLFVAMFKPLGIAIAALMGVIFLGDTLHAGSVIGATVIVAGFYAVIWAQSKEEEHSNGTTIEHVHNAHSQNRRIIDEKITEMKDGTRVRHDQNLRSHSRKATYEMVTEMKDQVIRAKAYLGFTPPGSNSHFVKELKQRIREVERAVGQATKDSNLSRSSLQKMRVMEATLLKASRIFPDCPDMVTKLRAMTHNTEELVQAQKNQATRLVRLAARTTPKGLHCLSMRLTADYFALQPEERLLPNQQKLQDADLYHYAVFSDNVLACAVVVNSTISTAMDSVKIVFHVVTDSLNLPAISMWFLLNPPGKATIQIQSIDNFEWLSTKYNTTLKKQSSGDPRYTSELNHLRFYLPDVFPGLDKIVLFDHDVVVQRDLTELWSINMKGKVNGAVETCHESAALSRRMDLLINFSDPLVAKRFDVNACTWAFGMNFFDLREWRRQNLTAVYHNYLQLGNERPLWKAGSLPLGWIVFYNQTMALDRRWHVLGLGYDSDVRRGDIERAAVIHYDGVMKPWFDIAVGRYKDYWNQHVKYDHPYLEQCNIHE